MRHVRSPHERVAAVVRRIPRGRVATYGQVAELAGLGAGARQVGYALHALGDTGGLPWHRVINARGMVSLPPASHSALTQRLLLEAEGVRFDQRGRVSLARYQWRPRCRSST
jgi:methylated-DNA-protein-cysteine methyltransferase-like protein